jgi:hypothetical protein
MSSAPKAAPDTKPNAPPIRTILPIIWELIRPRRGVLAIGFVLMVINRVSGLVLPYSTKYLIDTVIVKHHAELLKSLVLLVLGATAIQGITSFALTQLLSKAAQRLIAELRPKVQAHVGHWHWPGRSGGRTDYRRHCPRGSVPDQRADDSAGSDLSNKLCLGLKESLKDDPAHFP